MRCGDNGHYEVFYLYIWDERLFIPFYLFIMEKNGSDIAIFINGRIVTSANFASRCSLTKTFPKAWKWQLFDFGPIYTHFYLLKYVNFKIQFVLRFVL